MKSIWPCLLFLIALGCATPTPDSTPASTPTDAQPGALFTTLEERFLNADTVFLNFHVSAAGVIDADIRGRLEVIAGNAVRLTGSGEFAGQPVDLLIWPKGEQIELGNGTDKTIVPKPAALREALLVGFTRMGILHNLARLTGSLPPDQADGGVHDWVLVDSFAQDPIESGAITFDLSLAGQRVGSAWILTDESGRPVRRLQTVRFPAGEMRVVERYSNVIIE